MQLTDNISYRNKNGTVTVVGNGLTVNTTNAIIATLPDGFRPSHLIFGVGFCGTYGASSFNISVNTEGVLRAQTSASYTNGAFTLIFDV